MGNNVTFNDGLKIDKRDIYTKGNRLRHRIFGYIKISDHEYTKLSRFENEIPLDNLDNKSIEVFQSKRDMFLRSKASQKIILTNESLRPLHDSSVTTEKNTNGSVVEKLPNKSTDIIENSDISAAELDKKYENFGREELLNELKEEVGKYPGLDDDSKTFLNGKDKEKSFFETGCFGAHILRFMLILLKIDKSLSLINIMNFSRFFSERNPDFSWNDKDALLVIQDFKEGKSLNELDENALQERLNLKLQNRKFSTEEIEKIDIKFLSKKNLIFVIELMARYPDLSSKEIYYFSQNFLSENPNFLCENSDYNEKIQGFRNSIPNLKDSDIELSNATINSVEDSNISPVGFYEQYQPVGTSTLSGAKFCTESYETYKDFSRAELKKTFVSKLKEKGLSEEKIIKPFLTNKEIIFTIILMSKYPDLSSKEICYFSQFFLDEYPNFSWNFSQDFSEKIINDYLEKIKNYPEP